jgi:hypothetical protein
MIEYPALHVVGGVESHHIDAGQSAQNVRHLVARVHGTKRVVVLMLFAMLGHAAVDTNAAWGEDLN